jgi:hypothetical protein
MTQFTTHTTRRLQRIGVRTSPRTWGPAVLPKNCSKKNRFGSPPHARSIEKTT